MYPKGQAKGWILQDYAVWWLDIENLAYIHYLAICGLSAVAQVTVWKNVYLRRNWLKFSDLGEFSVADCGEHRTSVRVNAA
jgi:hypothetical protein